MVVGLYPQQSGGSVRVCSHFRDVYPVLRRPCRASLLSKEPRANNFGTARTSAPTLFPVFLCRWLPQRGEAFPLAKIIARVAGEVLPPGCRAYAKGIAKPRSFIPVLRRRGDAVVTGFNSDHQSFESAAVPECESDNQLLWRLGPFSGSRPAGFRGVFY
jgi:hypothetical protein